MGTEMERMKRVWAGVLIAAVVAAGAGAGALRTGHAQRVMRYAERRFGLTEEGRRAAFQALWYQAKAEYYAAVPNPYGAFQRAEYPAKARLLAREDETVAAVKQDLTNYADENFLMDLLLSLGPDTARPILEASLRSGPCHYPSQAVVAALRGSFAPDELKQLGLELPGYCALAAIQALPLEAKDQAYEEALLLKLNGPTGFPYWLMDDHFYPEAVRLFPALDRAGKLSVLGSAKYRKVDATTLNGWLAAEQDPAVRQELLFLLNDTEALLAAIEQDGAYKGTSVWSNWRWMQATAAKYPDSYLARGIKAYEAVRGMPYFGIDRHTADIPMYQYGNRWYDCDREIPGWEEYLQTYSKHDGADDAAYRLGRCYEITGQYEKALGALRLAMDLPDGEMASHARARIGWILDVLVPDEQLSPLRPTDLGLRTAAAYSLAVRKLRSGRYGEAAHDLAALTEGNQPRPLPELFSGEPSFWQDVARQRDLAARLARLAAEPTPENRYAIAAAMYHEEQLFYNYLWIGGKLGYLMEKGNPIDGDMTPAVERWAFESNNYLQAARAFEPLEATPGTVGDKAAYSRAMALLRATQSLTPDVPLYRPRQEINQEAQNLLERFVKERAGSDLAPDALLSLGFLTRDQAYFDRILKEYPRSDAAVTAREGINKHVLWREWRAIPFSYLTIDEAPPQVAGWARPFLGTQGARSMTLGEYTYVLGTTDQTGKAVTAGVGQNYDGPGLSVGIGLLNDPRKTAPDYALIRFKAGAEPVTINFWQGMSAN